MCPTWVSSAFNSQAGRILRFLASTNMITESGEETFVADHITRTLAVSEISLVTKIPCRVDS